MAWSEDALEAEEEAAAHDKARMCIYGGIQPSEYDQLTDLEREAFVEVLNSTNQR